MCSRYSGTLFIIKYLFIQYVILAGPIAIIALVIGILASVAELVIPLGIRYRKCVLCFIGILPVFIGIVGTIVVATKLQSAVSIEYNAGINPPTAERYYDLQYGYSKSLLIFFPFIMGLVSAAVTFFTMCFIPRKKRDCH